MISGYAHHGDDKKAIVLFMQMQTQGVSVDKVTYVSVLSACASDESLPWGQRIHACLIRVGVESHVFVNNALIGMYARCGLLQGSYGVFNRMSARDGISWNAMLSAYSCYCHDHESIMLFNFMQLLGLKPDKVAYVSILNACASTKSLGLGKHLHSQLQNFDLQPDIFVSSALIDMYTKCGSTKDACEVFNKMSVRDIVTWNSVISAYALYGNITDIFSLFGQMQDDGLRPDGVTYTSALSACATACALGWGKHIHVHLIKGGLKLDTTISNIIIGYAEHGDGGEALKLFEQMQDDGFQPDKYTYVGVLNACAGSGSLELGRHIHTHLFDAKVELDIFVGNALIDMYAKCGGIEEAHQVFSRMPARDIVSWTSVIAGYAQHGDANQALLLFKEMEIHGVKPDNITFLPVLTACSYMGLVDLGRKHFDSMSCIHGIQPSKEHYACMIDLLGRSGRLHEAKEFLYAMPFKPDTIVWMAFLSACKIHGNVELAESAVEEILKLGHRKDFSIFPNAFDEENILDRGSGPSTLNC